jgi:hypothetical protein
MERVGQKREREIKRGRGREGDKEKWRELDKRERGR